jgi:membrane fusion protein (multidrug efflux system)
MDAVMFAPGAQSQTAPARHGYRKLLLELGAVLVAAIAGVFGYQWFTAGRFIESTNDAYVGGDVTAIAPHVAGFVSEIAIGDNQYVRQGQLLMRLDDRDFVAADAHAEAVVSGKRAALADLEARYTLQQSTIREANATLSAKVAQAAFAKDDDARYQSLMRAVATSRQAVQRAYAADQEAQSDVAGARANATAANQQLSVLEADIAQARADVAQADADLKTARLNLTYTEIRAPVDGYLGNRAVHVGAYVGVGTYLASVIPAHGLWVDANFKEDQLAHIRPGQDVVIFADVLPNEKFRGHVASLAPGTGAVFSVIPPENATGNFTKIVQRVPVRILLDSDGATLGGLRPGLSIVAKVDTRSAL